jgi:MoaA/NifB/PqqE/SkfB family radical SAM enzyme
MIRERINLTKNILVSNFRRLSFPYKLTFVLTYWCNYKCKTCNIWQRKPENELSTEEIIRFFEHSNRFNWIDFTGGEIWLRNDVVEIVGAALKNCKNLALIHFPTNGYQTKRIVSGVKEIMKMKPPKFIITVSLDGDEETNDEVRGRKGGWKKQIDTFRQLRAIPGVEVVLGMTLSKYNAGQYQRTFEAVKKAVPDLKHQDFHMHIAHGSSHFYENQEQDVLDAATHEILMKELAQYKLSRGPIIGPVSYLENRYLSRVKAYLESGKTPMKCHSLSASCFIDSWGNVYPCVTYDKIVGNLRDYDYDLSALWNQSELIELQKEIKQGQCPQCWQPCEAYQTILGNIL